MSTYKTCGEIISKVDNLEPNQYTVSDKLAWLSSLDGQIYEELLMTHNPVPEEDFVPYSSLTDKVLVPEPYGAEMYSFYLQAMIADQNGETAKYNQQITLYNNSYTAYSNLYNRTHTYYVASGNRLHY